MKVFSITVASNRQANFQELADRVAVYLKQQQLTSRDVKWLQSSADGVTTLTAIVG